MWKTENDCKVQGWKQQEIKQEGYTGGAGGGPRVQAKVLGFHRKDNRKPLKVQVR